MFSSLYLPDSLYRAWPWLVTAIGIGFVFAGCPGVSFLLALYAGWIIWQRDFT